MGRVSSDLRCCVGVCVRMNQRERKRKRKNVCVQVKKRVCLNQCACEKKKQCRSLPLPPSCLTDLGTHAVQVLPYTMPVPDTA
eukprot:2630804-Rhodomonas_salina.5